MEGYLYSQISRKVLIKEETGFMRLNDLWIRTKEDLVKAVQELGILPFFANSIPGFSIEEHVSQEIWFTDKPGPWEWKGPVIRETGCAYGKFFENKAAYISREWFPDFANFRRDGYDFDARYEDELASYRDKQLYDLLEREAPVLSGDLKKSGNYGKNGNKGFDTILTRLQAQGYVLTSDFVYRRDKKGNEYGWGVALYSTPEKFWGEEFTGRVYKKTPEQSFATVKEHLMKILPDVQEELILRFLQKNSPARISSGTKAWLIPSNPRYYDVVSAFEAEEVIAWKQGNDNIKTGDLVYLYVGQPYSAVLYKCVVEETGIPYLGHNENVNIKNLMMIRRLAVYAPDVMPLSRMKQHGVNTVRGPRFMPEEISDLL